MSELTSIPNLPDADKKAERELVEELVARYDDFQDDVTKLLATKETVQPIGEGAFSVAYILRHLDDEYVIRVPLGDDKSSSRLELEKHLAAAVRIGDIPHLEHIVAASYETGVTIAQYAPGKGIRSMIGKEIDAITKDQISDLFSSMSTAYGLGVGSDPWGGGNLLYDAEAGFTMLDLGVIDDERLADESLAVAPAGALELLFDNFGSDVIEEWEDSDEQAKFSVSDRLLEAFQDFYHPEVPGPTTDDLSRAMTLLQRELTIGRSTISHT